jgi:hypothetical protein
MIMVGKTIKTSSALTMIKYNRYIHSRDEKENVTLRSRPNNLVIENIMYIVDVIMQMMIIIQEHSQVFNTVGTDYRGLTKFSFVDQYVSFSTEGYNFSCVTAEFDVVSSAPTLYGINVRLQKIEIS